MTLLIISSAALHFERELEDMRMELFVISLKLPNSDEQLVLKL
jgi:hypothetical protein